MVDTAPTGSRVPDRVVSVVLLVVAALLGLLGALVSLLLVAFLDHCEPPSCSTDDAVSAAFTAVLSAFALWVAGTVTTVVRLARRRPGWPFALATTVLVVVCFVVGGFLLDAATT